ncbi:MAG: DNA-binding domain-containing protein [Betaproteobacteria bacterium]
MLRDLQRAMAGSLVAGDATAAEHIRGGKLGSVRRLEVYRHNVFTNLRGALKDIFPVVNRIVGEAFFWHAADQFIRATPSRSGDLNRFGFGWPEFLAQYPHAADLPYLADVARLEWAWHECFHAADAAPLDVARLAGVAPENYGALVLHLHPAVRLLDSVFPVLRIWQVNQPEFCGDQKIDWETAGGPVLVRRDAARDVEVVIESLTAGAWQFLRAVHAGRALDEAASAALEIDGQFDLQGFLLETVQSGVITDYSGEQTC